MADRIEDKSFPVAKNISKIIVYEGCQMLTLILFCVILFAMLIIEYIIFDKEILSPSVICTAMYLLSCVYMIFYVDKWNLDLSLKTMTIILLALISVAVGEFIAKRTKTNKKLSIRLNNRGDSKNRKNNYVNGIAVNKSVALVCFIFSALTAILYFIEIVNIAANSEYAQSEYGSQYSFLMQVRWAMTLEDAEVAYYVQQMFTITGAIAYILTYVVLYNIIYAKNKIKNLKLNYFTMIMYVVITFMTTGRAKMLNFFIYIICLYLILYYQKNKWGGVKISLIIKSILLVVAVITLFYLAGLLTEKSLHYDNFFDNFANYFSSSIYGLNEWTNNPKRFSDGGNYFGIHTLSGIYSFLRTLGFQIPDSIVAYEYIDVGGYNSNIYTPLRRYIQDFGIFGMILIMFMIGFIYKKLIMANKKKDSSPFMAILTACFIYPLFFMSIEERVFMDVVMVRSVYSIIYMLFFYWLIVKRSIKRRVSFKRRVKIKI